MIAILRRYYAPTSSRLAWLLLVCLCGGVGLSRAGPLYRCTGSRGETVFTGETVGYQQCKRLTGFTKSQQKTPSATVMPLPKPEGFQGVVGTATSTVAISPLAAATSMPAPPLPRPPAGHWSYRDSRQDDPAAARGEAQALASVRAQGPNTGDRILRGTVYRVVRSDGSVEYTNLPPRRQKGRAVTMLFSYISTCVACNLRSPINWNTVALDVAAYAEAIRAASAEFGVDRALLRAVIHAESAFNPRALSIKGAQGLMQLMPSTAGEMGVRDAFDATQNIRGGARYLAILLRNFGGDERLAAAAYNAGERAVQRYRGVPPYAETQVYVERVGTLRRRYGQASVAVRSAAG